MGIRYDKTVTNTGSSAVLAMDLKANPTCISLFTHIVTGGPTFKVEYTNDNIQSPTFDASTATWHPHPTINAVTSDTDGNFAFPVYGVRLTVTAVGAPTDAVRLVVIQAGPGA